MPDPSDLQSWAQQSVNGWLTRSSVPEAPVTPAVTNPTQGSILGQLVQGQINRAKTQGLGNVVSVKKKRSTPQLIPLSRHQGQ